MNEELEVIRAVLEHSDEIVLVCRQGGNNLTFSEAAAKIFGPPRFIALQEDDAARYGLFYPGSKDLIPTSDLPMARALKGQTVRDVLISVRRSGQPEYLVSLNAGPLRDGNGTFYGGVVVGSILHARQGDEHVEAHGLHSFGAKSGSGDLRTTDRREGYGKIPVSGRADKNAHSPESGYSNAALLHQAALVSGKGKDQQEQAE